MLLSEKAMIVNEQLAKPISFSKYPSKKTNNNSAATAYKSNYYVWQCLSWTNGYLLSKEIETIIVHCVFQLPLLP